MKIKVYMQTLNESHVLYVNDAKRDYVLLDTKETNYSADRFIFKVCDMVSNWPKELRNDIIIDGLTYKVVIKNNQEEREYIFQNNFPKDIYRLKMLIDEVLGEVKDV